MFLTVKHCFSEPLLGLDLRLVRPVLVSLSPGPSDIIQIAHQSRCSFRFTRLRLCVGVTRISVAIDK